MHVDGGGVRADWANLWHGGQGIGGEENVSTTSSGRQDGCVQDKMVQDCHPTINRPRTGVLDWERVFQDCHPTINRLRTGVLDWERVFHCVLPVPGSRGPDR
jgi:hypothetical protein